MVRECEFPPTAQKHAGSVETANRNLAFQTVHNNIDIFFLYDLFYLYGVKNISGSLKEASLDEQQQQTRADAKNVITSSLYLRRLTCLSPPAPGTTAPWRYAAARRNWRPHQSVPTTSGRSPRCKRAGSWRRGPTERRRRAGWGRPCPLPLWWPARWTGTPGSP